MRTWEDCAAFHGHVCPGLAGGYQAARLATKLLELSFSEDEQVVCIAENDACGVDAVQVMTGCSVGKGNLLFHMTGKQAFSFYNRTNGKSVRLVMKAKPKEMSKEESLCYILEQEPEVLFDSMEPRMEAPSRARFFASFVCEDCGETAGEYWLRVQEGKKLCVDCAKRYDRFHV